MGRIIFTIDGPVATIALDSPDNHNAVDAAMRQALTEAYETIDKDDSIRVGVIHGANGGSFCAGGSIDGYLQAQVFGPDAQPLPRIPRPFPARKPYIAAMTGFALGGGFALALTCDLRVAGKGAQMGPTGLKLGAVQGAQTISRLTRLLGGSRALEVLLLSKQLTGEQAAEIGLVNAVTDDDKVLKQALEWARAIAEFSPWAVAMTKQLVYEGQHLSLEDAIAWEDQVATEGYKRPEALEGFTAFKERRHPKF
ncbi:enoyl-CoA hydratase/isomerase family protein [Polaromonas hydrogenivorans]|uniref:Enoyl-CoA hydratase/isomerase family protein n=1 Tax=Polaromonas hydrogenivorans TaxID=335476 RepID=A0AAU7M024_9BURK